MATIKLSTPTTEVLLPEGIHVFFINLVEYDGHRIRVTMQTADGTKHIEKFNLYDANGVANTGACNAFSFFARNVMQDFNLAEIDHTALIGRYVQATVGHVTGNKPDANGNYRQFNNLSDWKPANAFEAVAPVQTAPAAPLASDNWMDILN